MTKIFAGIPQGREEEGGVGECKGGVCVFMCSERRTQEMAVATDPVQYKVCGAEGSEVRNATPSSQGGETVVTLISPPK